MLVPLADARQCPLVVVGVHSILPVVLVSSVPFIFPYNLCHRRCSDRSHARLLQFVAAAGRFSAQRSRRRIESERKNPAQNGTNETKPTSAHAGSNHKNKTVERELSPKKDKANRDRARVVFILVHRWKDKNFGSTVNKKGKRGAHTVGSRVARPE